MGAIYAIASTILLNSFVLVEQRQVEGDLAQATDAINNDMNLLANQIIDYATWDENYQFLQGKNPGFCEMGLTDVTFVTSNMNFLAVVRSTGQVLCRKGFDLIREKPIPFVESLQRHLAVTDLLLQNPNPKSLVVQKSPEQ